MADLIPNFIISIIPCAEHPMDPVGLSVEMLRNCTWLGAGFCVVVRGS